MGLLGPRPARIHNLTPTQARRARAWPKLATRPWPRQAISLRPMANKFETRRIFPPKI
jgi:hypothetical protein